MALAGHAASFSVSSDDASYSEVDGISESSFKYAREMLETTDTKDTSGALTHIAGLIVVEGSGGGDYEGSDTGQALIRSSAISGATIYGKWLWNGSAGHKCAFIVQDWTADFGTHDKVKFKFTLKQNGAPSTV